MFFCLFGKKFVYLQKLNEIMGRVTITDDKLYSDIVAYCKENDEKIGEFCTRLLKGAFAVEVYGDVPFGFVVAKFPYEKEEPKVEEVVVEEKAETPVKEEVIEKKNEPKAEEENILETPRKRRL